MQFQEQATGIAENRTDFISAPERGRRRRAVLASWLQGFAVSVVGHRSHHGDGVSLISTIRD